MVYTEKIRRSSISGLFLCEKAIELSKILQGEGTICFRTSDSLKDGNGHFAKGIV